jgi:ligand-binding sensor domain-containing protein
VAVVTADDHVTGFGTGGTPILSLLQVHESLWVGSAAGLALLPPGEQAPHLVDADPALRAPIVALTQVGDTLVAATSDQLAWRDPTGGQWTLSRAGAAAVGTVSVLSGERDGVWVGGSAGLVFWRIGRAASRPLHIPGDLPATIRDLAALPPYVWVATDSGLVRLRRDAVRP